MVGDRLPPLAARQVYAITRLDRAVLDTAPQGRLDDLLRRVPGFSLFRRSSSRVANPTTQGVTLRGLGPNGAGRTLVLLDGVPQNDPFGGWVYWSGLDVDAVGSVTVTRGGGAGIHGSQALAGTIELASALPEGTTAGAKGVFGRFDTVDVSGFAATDLGGAQVAVRGLWYDSDGYFLLSEDQRGPVDVPAASQARVAEGTLRVPLDAATHATVRARYFEEERVNGLALSTNATEAVDVSVNLRHDGGRSAPSWQVVGYWRDRDFANSFASVTQDRGETRQVLDQFDVPATGWGGSAMVRLPLSATDTLEVGADARRLDGQTNERFRNLGAGFTRLRLAGGDQLLVGAYAEYAGSLTETVTLTAGLRGDYWRSFDGVRRETDTDTGDVLRDDAIADRDGAVVNGRLGLGWQATGAVGVRAAGYTGYRLPTINEFFRPFRVRNDITEANPELAPERLYGLEAALDYAPLNTVSLSLTYFRNWLADGVGNVTLAQGPGFFPPTGFVPAGGTLRQRRNIDLIVADGLEASGRIALAGGWTLTASYLFVAARVRAFDAQPDLEGNRVAQSPRHTVTAGARWRPGPRWQVSVEGRYGASQFDDDLNTRLLDDFISLDARLAFRPVEPVTLFAAVENAFDATIETARSADGLITLGPPRLWTVGVSAAF